MKFENLQRGDMFKFPHSEEIWTKAAYLLNPNSHPSDAYAYSNHIFKAVIDSTTVRTKKTKTIEVWE